MNPLLSASNSVRRSRKIGTGVLLSALATTATVAMGIHNAYGAHAIQDPKTGPGPSQTLMAPAPPGAVVLFSGKEADLAANWTRRNPAQPAGWPVQDGTTTPVGGDIMSKQRFTDFMLHIEFRTPLMPDAKGQARGNSGVFVQGRYEVQVLDSYGLPDPGKGDCGAVYNKSAPLINACRPPREWQTYDIVLKGAKVDATGKVTSNAFITVVQNGIPVQNNQEIVGVCGAALDEKVGEPGPLILQDHGNKVEYRNIWILPLPLQGATHY